MKKLLTFVLLGLGFAAPGEILNQILARRNVRAFASTIISYAVLLLVGFFVAGRYGQSFRKAKVLESRWKE